MGPQSCDCGKHDAKELDYGNDYASMGPQSCDCGKQKRRGAFDQGEAASMGPQSCDCGKSPRGGSDGRAAYGFNGAAVLRLRKGIDDVPTHEAKRRFNG